jgi:hypothetical protein
MLTLIHITNVSYDYSTVGKSTKILLCFTNSTFKTLNEGEN